MIYDSSIQIFVITHKWKTQFDVILMSFSWIAAVKITLQDLQNVVLGVLHLFYGMASVTAQVTKPLLDHV